MTSPKKPGVAFWATVAVVAALVYPLSMGPAIWLYEHKAVPRWVRAPMAYFYSPLEWIAFHGPKPIRNAFIWYSELWRSSP